MTLRKDLAPGSLPRGSTQLPAGEGRGSPTPQTLRPSLFFPFLFLALSYFQFSESRFLFLSPRSQLLSRHLRLRVPFGVCLCIFHILSRCLSKVCCWSVGVFSGFCISGLCVSLSVRVSVSGIFSLGLCRLLALCAPTLRPPPGKLAHTSRFLPPPARPFPASLIPHASGRRVAGLPPAAAATCEQRRGGPGSRARGPGFPRSSGRLHLPPRPSFGHSLRLLRARVSRSLSLDLGVSVPLSGTYLGSVSRDPVSCLFQLHLGFIFLLHLRKARGLSFSSGDCVSPWEGSLLNSKPSSGPRRKPYSGLGI